MMKTRLTILCENSVAVPFSIIGEHGFACYIETEQGNYLFDTGQGLGIINNATVLKKDLAAVHAIIISHGHYDHTGGLAQVLQLTGRKTVFAHPEIFTERFWEREGALRYIGIPFARPYLESLGAEFKFTDQMIEVGKNVYITGEIPRMSTFEKGDRNMFVRDDNNTISKLDPLKDDLSLVIDTDKGLVVVFGCAHAGMINILDHVVKTLGKDTIYAVIGGTHLNFSSEEQFAETVKIIDKYGIERFGVSHCTGLAKASQLHAILKEKFFFANAGISIEV